MPPTSVPEYMRVLTGNPDMALSTLLSMFFLCLFRIAPIVSLAPFLGSKLPGAVKMGLAISLTLLFLPETLVTTTTRIDYNIQFLGFALKELLIGYIIGFLSTIPFYIAQGSGALIDYMRGSSSLQVQDPTTQSQTSSIGVLFNYTLIVIFFQIGGPFFFFGAIQESFAIIPLDKMLPTSFFNLSLPFWKTILGLLTRITTISIQLAAPSIVAILMAEVFLGIANRLAPRVQIVFLGMSLKSLFGLGLLWAAWFFILKQLSVESLDWVKQIDIMLRSMGA